MMAAAITEGGGRASGNDSNKQELLAKVVNLESRVQSLEREKNGHLFNKRSEFRPVFCALEEVELKYSSDRKDEKQELKQSIGRIRTNVAAFKRMLTDMRPGPTFVEALKKAMEEIESSVAAFKEKQRNVYELLLQEEKTVDIEVTAFEKKLDSWLTVKSKGSHTTNTGPVMTHTTQPTPSSVPPAVMAFERFLQQTGGRQGGWDDYDHQTFIKIRTKFNGHPSYIEAASGELPTKTMDEIRGHDQWYSEFCALLESKKKAIDVWKRQKQSKKRVPVLSVSDDKLDATTKSKEDLLTKEREERLKKLSEWKAQQEAKAKLDKEKRLRAEAERSRDAERQKKRKTALKAQVAEYSRERELSLEVERQRREAEKLEEVERRREATKEVEKFRERDFKELTVRKEKAKRKEEEAQERIRALEKTKQTVKVQADPNRLFKLTAGWEERKKAGLERTDQSGQAISLPRRAVPTWRQGL